MKLKPKTVKRFYFFFNIFCLNTVLETKTGGKNLNEAMKICR